ncbi:uncharacterized protein TNCV_4392731 [Trichonephila clavipes]|nr:uncharacterized protein TNCV_4392731 [Trichonephila clavipes]
MGFPHTNTIFITAQIEYGFIAKDNLVPFRCSPVSSCVAPLQTEKSIGGLKGNTRNGHRDPKCPSARHLRMVREDTGAPDEGTTCSWMAVNEAIGCPRAFLTMWRSSQQLVCRGRPKPGLRVNGISRIQWSQDFLNTQSERPNLRATRLAVIPAAVNPMILPLSNCDNSSYCLRNRLNAIPTSDVSLQTIQYTQTSRRRRIEEADINTPVTVEQHVANHLEEVLRSFTTMRSSFRTSHSGVTFRYPLQIFRVVRCSSVHCFQTRITVELFRCTRAPIVR